VGEGTSLLEQFESLVDIAFDVEIAGDVGTCEAELARRRRDSTESVGGAQHDARPAQVPLEGGEGHSRDQSRRAERPERCSGCPWALEVDEDEPAVDRIALALVTQDADHR
jgi:hypothetical protein